MEFLNTVLSYASMAVMAMGGGVAISGLLNISEGKAQHNAGKQDEGMSKIVGGGAIIIVGLFLVPKIVTLFPAG